jgi:predicted transcriptional regulator of viral defense system
MASTISMEEALTSWILGEYPYSVIAREKISEQIYIFYKDKSHGKDKLRNISKAHPEPRDYSNYIEKLLRSGVLVAGVGVGRGGDARVAEGFYYISGKSKYSAQEAICAVYPYGYISYISAMEWYGLTEKIPKIARFTVCSKSAWKDKYIAEFADRLGEIRDFNGFVPKYPKSGLYFDRRELLVTMESSFVEPVSVRGGVVRVSSIGKTFVDMVRRPELCGGDEHVFEMYLEHGAKYSKNIIDSAERFGRKIDRARVGFLLDKVLGVQDERLYSWREDARGERGSSRVYSPGRPFSSIYCADWSLSLNLELVEGYGNTN